MYTSINIWITDKIWYMAKGHPKVGWAPIGFAVAAPWTNLPQGIVLGWAPIGFAVMVTPRPSQYYFGHTQFCPILIWGAVEIYYNCLVCFWKVIGFLGGPYRFTGFCCIWHHHEILVCSDIKNCMKEAMEIADKKEDEIVFCDTESMEQQKARSRQRNGLGIEPVGVALGHIHNVGSRPPGCRSWSGGCNELACGGCRMQCGHAQNRLWARQYWRYVPPSFPGPKFQQMVIGRVIGFFSGNFRNYRF